MNTQTKINLQGFTPVAELIDAPKWVATKSRVAWAHGAVIAERRRQGDTLQTLADQYDVSLGTIDRIAKAQPVHNADQETIRSLRYKLRYYTEQLERTEATMADVRDTGAGFERSWYRANDEITELQSKLANSKLGEASAIARLNDPSMANKWKAEAHQEYLRRDEAERDRAAAETQIEMMAERLAECRGRGFWARLLNR
tara:strand:- start:75 stop:674 length:600 start_codon:yes stop_codon:yes gene_type:complete